MKFIYKILAHQATILVRMSGNITFHTFVKAMQYAWADEEYNAEYNTLVDLRDANVKITTSEISALINMLLSTKQAKDARFTLVVNKPFEAALAMIFESKLVKAMPSKSFTRLDDAAHYIGMEPEVVEDILDHQAREAPLEEILNDR